MRYTAKKYLINTLRGTFLVYVLLGMGVSTGAFAGGHKSAPAQPDIVDTAVAAGSFTTLVAALQAADLVDALKGEGPFTVFAPTDEAFAKFTQHWPGAIENLLKPENQAQLQRLLTYHVVSGKVMAADISGTMTPATLEGGSLNITTDNGVKVDYATVVQADIETSNGVIHVIDAVLIPSENE
jgi:uncharacterized surface protein with fasciclin (FAS1) repeats